VAAVLVRAGAEDRDRLVARAAAESVDGRGRNLLPVAADVVLPGQAPVLDLEEQFPGGREVAVPLVDLVAADAAGPEAHDEDAGSIFFVRRVVDPFRFQHLFL
jgi:hypothetical protein